MDPHDDPRPPASDTFISTRATVRHVALVRHVAGAFGAHLDLPVDCIDDLRLAVDEACALLLETFAPVNEPPGRLAVSFDVDGAQDVLVDVCCSPVRPAGTPSEVTTLVLDALTTDWACGLRGDEAMVTLRLRSDS